MLNIKVKAIQKHYQLKNILINIGPYLKDIINNLKKYHMWKIQLTIAINFISSKDSYKERERHSERDNAGIIINDKADEVIENTEIIINDKADEVLENIFDSLNKKYQIILEKSMRGSDFIFDCVHVLYYKCHKINRNCGGSYIDFPDWIKNKKAAITLINKKDNKCFQ